MPSAATGRLFVASLSLGTAYIRDLNQQKLVSFGLRRLQKGGFLSPYFGYFDMCMFDMHEGAWR